MKRLLSLIAALVLAGGGFWAAQVSHDLERGETNKKAAAVAAEEAKLRSTLESSVATLTKERDEAREQAEQLGGQVKSLSQKLTETQAKLAKESEALARAVAQPKPQPAQGANANPMKAMSEMMKTPAMKDAVIQQNLAQVDLIYGKLFDKLQLDGADKQDFKNLISERMRAELEMSLQMMGGDSSPQQSASALEQFTKAKAESDRKIRSFLNNESDYQTFQTWEQTKADRMMVNMGAPTFAGAGDPLTIEQEDKLVAAMAAARTQASGVPDMSKPENLTPGNLGPQMIEKILSNYDAQASQVASGASAYLSPNQIEALKAFQKQQRSMQEMGLKMGASMVGGK